MSGPGLEAGFTTVANNFVIDCSADDELKENADAFASLLDVHVNGDGEVEAKLEVSLVGVCWVFSTMIFVFILIKQIFLYI